MGGHRESDCSSVTELSVCLFYFASSLYSTVHVNMFVNTVVYEFCVKTSYVQQNVVSVCLTLLFSCSTFIQTSHGLSTNGSQCRS